MAKVVKIKVKNAEGLYDNLIPQSASIAEYGVYASLDTSKGTIEERLTALGARQGSVILASNITATENELKRQGNYVLGHISGSFPPVESNVTVSIGTLPEDFMTKNWFTFNVVLNGDHYGWGDFSVNAQGKVFIYTRPGIGTGSDIKFDIYLGYEAKPL